MNTKIIVKQGFVVLWWW